MQWASPGTQQEIGDSNWAPKTHRILSPIQRDMSLHKLPQTQLIKLHYWSKNPTASHLFGLLEVTTINNKLMKSEFQLNAKLTLIIQRKKAEKKWANIHFSIDRTKSYHTPSIISLAPNKKVFKKKITFKYNLSAKFYLLTLKKENYCHDSQNTLDLCNFLFWKSIFNQNFFSIFIVNFASQLPFPQCCYLNLSSFTAPMQKLSQDLAITLPCTCYMVWLNTVQCGN